MEFVFFDGAKLGFYVMSDKLKSILFGPNVRNDAQYLKSTIFD
jgi:hypothetical protein